MQRAVYAYTQPMLTLRRRRISRRTERSGEIMNIRKLLVTSLLAAGTVVAPHVAMSRVNVDVAIGPPAPRYEVVPAPRHGYIWAPGYWAWDGHRPVWHSGRWIRERHGHHWVADRWERRGDHWYFHGGHWDRG